MRTPQQTKPWMPPKRPKRPKLKKWLRPKIPVPVKPPPRPPRPAACRRRASRPATRQQRPRQLAPNPLSLWWRCPHPYCRLGRLDGQSQRLNAVVANLMLSLADLDADAGVGPVLYDKRRSRRIAVTQILHLSQGAVGQTDSGDVHKGEDLGPRRRRDVFFEAEKVRPPGTAGIDDRGHPRGQTERVRFDPPRGGSGVHVSVDVHPARGEDLARQV